MDVKSKFLEDACKKFKSNFSKEFDWHDVDVTFSRLDLINRRVFSLSNNYEWILLCWDDDLDKKVSERLFPGIQHWSNYSEGFNNTLQKSDKKNKVDFCNKFDNVYEITSINTKRNLTLKELMYVYNYSPVLSEYSHNIWKNKDSVILPFRNDIKKSSQISAENSEVKGNYKFMRFGDVRLTRKEMLTIRMLLSQCRVKEIAYAQGCTEAVEHKRILRLKEKLGCPHASSSQFFNALKDHNITTAFIDVLMDYP